MKPFAITEIKYVLMNGITAFEVHRRERHRAGNRKTLQFRFTDDGWRVDVVNLFAFNLREESNLGITVKRSNGSGRTDKNPRFEADDLLVS